MQSIDIIGATNKDFSFDNENPSFKKKIDEFNVHCMTVTNGEWREFIKNGIYQKPQYWLSDGFEFITKNNIAITNFNFANKVSIYNFIHGAEYSINKKLKILACYHPSPRNVNTGRINEKQMIEVLKTVSKY